MVALDAAGFWILVDLEQDEAVSLLCREFNKDYKHKTLKNGAQDLYIDNSFIKKITVREKGTKSRLDILFNYPEAYEKTNFTPLSSEFKKIEVEEMIISKLKKAFKGLDDGETWTKRYFTLEATMQMDVPSVHHYHKPIMFLFRSLSENFNAKDKCIYTDFISTFKKFFTTGFTFQLDYGVLFKIYAKRAEHNKKHNIKEDRTPLRGELTLTETAIKKIVGTSEVETITLELLDIKISEYIKNNLKIHKKLEKTFVEDIEFLERKFSNLNPRELKSLVKDYSWKGLDDKVICWTIENNTDKSYRQILRYREKVRESLMEEQERGAFLTSNFNNVSRLEFLMSSIFLIDIKIKLRKGVKPSFILH